MTWETVDSETWVPLGYVRIRVNPRGARRPSRFAGSCVRILNTRGVEELVLDRGLPSVARTKDLTLSRARFTTHRSGPRKELTSRVRGLVLLEQGGLRLTLIYFA